MEDNVYYNGSNAAIVGDKLRIIEYSPESEFGFEEHEYFIGDLVGGLLGGITGIGDKLLSPLTSFLPEGLQTPLTSLVTTVTDPLIGKSGILGSDGLFGDLFGNLTGTKQDGKEEDEKKQEKAGVVGTIEKALERAGIKEKQPPPSELKLLEKIKNLTGLIKKYHVNYQKAFNENKTLRDIVKKV